MSNLEKENIGLRERLDAMEKGKGKVRVTARMKRLEASLGEKFRRCSRSVFRCSPMFSLRSWQQ